MAESGIPAELITPRGTIVFNDFSAASTYQLVSVTGLRPQVRKSFKERGHRPGIKIGPGFQGGMFPVLEGRFLHNSPSAGETMRRELEAAAYSITNTDGTFRWQPSDAGGEWRSVQVQLYETPSVGTDLFKSFQLPLIVERPFIHGPVQNAQLSAIYSPGGAGGLSFPFSFPIVFEAGAAHSGAQGLRIKKAWSDSNGYVRKVFTPTDEFNASAWFRWRSIDPNTAQRANGTGPRIFAGLTRVVDVYRDDSTGELWLRRKDDGGVDRFTAIPTTLNGAVRQTVPLNTWMQVDVRVTYTGAQTATISVWLDGTERLNASYPLLSGGFDRFQLGSEHVSQYVDLDIDDVEITTHAFTENFEGDLSAWSAPYVTGSASVVIVAGVSGAGTFTNAGDNDTWPTVRIHGPVTEPLVQHEELDAEIQFTKSGGLVVAAGDFVDVDMFEETATLGSTGESLGRYVSWDTSVFFPLRPGANTLKLVGSGTSDASTRLTVLWYDSFA